jgi:hypothetical protein
LVNIIEGRTRGKGGTWPAYKKPEEINTQDEAFWLKIQSFEHKAMYFAEFYELKCMGRTMVKLTEFIRQMLKLSLENTNTRYIRILPGYPHGMIITSGTTPEYSAMNNVTKMNFRLEARWDV